MEVKRGGIGKGKKILPRVRSGAEGAQKSGGRLHHRGTRRKSTEGREKREDLPESYEGRGGLPGSLRSMAGAPWTARKKKPATPVGMTAWVSCSGSS
jgi:hypothetical protein